MKRQPQTNKGNINLLSYKKKRYFKTACSLAMSFLLFPPTPSAFAATVTNKNPVIEPGFLSDDDIALENSETDFSQVVVSRVVPIDNVKEVLSPREIQGYKACLSAIRHGSWQAAQQWISSNPDGLLTDFVTAELYLAKNSPKVSPDDIINLIQKSPYLPQGEALARLAYNHGVKTLPALPEKNNLFFLSGAPQRPVNHHNATNRSAMVFETKALNGL